jgi:hypothetical protein
VGADNNWLVRDCSNNILGLQEKKESSHAEKVKGKNAI